MKFSIIIPAYNATATIGRVLDACVRIAYPYKEIIVVDDGSTDSTADIAASYGPEVRILRQVNGGPAQARNTGWKASTGEICFFTDSDCLPRPDILSIFSRDFEDPKVGGSGGTYGIANPAALLSRLIHEEITYRHSFMEGEIDYLGSFNCAYRRSVLEQTGGFNEEYKTASGEDNDLSYRVRKKGWKLIFNSSAEVGHFHEASWLQYLRRQANHGVWRVKLYLEHKDMAKGDRYAGIADLAQPPLALAVAGLSPFFFFEAVRPLFLLAVFGYCLLVSVIPLRIALRRRAGEPLLIAPLAFFRGFARGYGLIKGVLKFQPWRIR